MIPKGSTESVEALAKRTQGFMQWLMQRPEQVRRAAQGWCAHSRDTRLEQPGASMGTVRRASPHSP